MNDEELLAKELENPLFFLREVLGSRLWEKQQEIAQSVKENRYTTVKSCHGAGKSFIAAGIVLWYLYTHVGSKVITTAPSFRQVKDILWREIRKAHSQSEGKLEVQPSLTSLNLGDDWFALGLSTNEPDRFQGFHSVDILLIMDEAAGIKEEIFEASEGITSSANARILYIGNPTNLAGSFYQSFKTESFNKIRISAFDTPNFTKFGITLADIRSNTWSAKITGNLPMPYLITPEWVYDKFIRWGEGNPMWDSRVMGDFPVQGEDTLIPLAYIERAARNEVSYKLDDEEVIGADIARFGTDKTCFVYRKGGKVIELKEYNHMDTMETANNLDIYSNTHPKAAVNIDEIGVGAGVVDRMKEKNRFKNVQGVNVGSSPYDGEMFVNLRAELFWALRERFADGSISIPEDEELMAQLANIKYRFTPKGLIQIESKEDIKKRGMGSPDKADALSLAFMKAKPKDAMLEFMSQYKV